MPFEFKQLSIPEVILITPKIFNDDRGFFYESFKKTDFNAEGININLVQENQSFSKKGVIRGLHYQLEPKAQGKLVRVVKGRILDVAVDIREDSETYGQWVSAELSASNKKMLWIPRGFAHGFQALEDSEIIYKTDNEYAPTLERGVRWNDPTINIKWPINNPVLSDKDSKLPFLK